MTIGEPDTIDRRIERLERSQKKLQGIASILGLLLVALAAWQFLPRNSVIHAKAFVLRDEQKRERAELSTWDDGTVVLRLNGKNEKARGLWRLNPDGRLILKLADAEGHSRAELALDEKGQPSLIFAEEGGHIRTWIGIQGSDGPAVRAR